MDYQSLKIFQEIRESVKDEAWPKFARLQLCILENEMKKFRDNSFSEDTMFELVLPGCKRDFTAFKHRHRDKLKPSTLNMLRRVENLEDHHYAKVVYEVIDATPFLQRRQFLNEELGNRSPLVFDLTGFNVSAMLKKAMLLYWWRAKVGERPEAMVALKESMKTFFQQFPEARRAKNTPSINCTHCENVSINCSCADFQPNIQ
ncbi:uncharacterized protein LOC144427140 [Styela clava]